jgi:hypothetical protein
MFTYPMWKAAGGGGAPALTTDMIAWWSLDEAAGATRVDSHTNSYDLTDVSTVAQAVGKVSNASSTAGGASPGLETNFAAAPLLYPADVDYTICMWVYFTSIANNAGLMSNWNFSAGHVLWIPPGESDLSWTVNGTTVQLIAPTLSVWTNLILIHDSVANEISMIVDDGTPVTAAHTTGFASPVGTDFQLHQYGAGAFSFDGRADEVAHWGRVLTPAEITELAVGIGYPGP